MQTTDRLITPGEFARIAGVSVDTVYRWIDRGYGPPPIRLGTGPRPRYRFRNASVEAFLRSQEAGVPARAQ